jgi:hypothetical protein
MLCYAPPRALWRASAEWNTKYDGRNAQAESWPSAASMQRAQGMERTGHGYNRLTA